MRESYESYARRRRQREAYAARYAAEKLRTAEQQRQKAAKARELQKRLAAMSPQERRAYEWQRLGIGVLKLLVFIAFAAMITFMFGTLAHPGPHWP
jgi:hypothetical protein